MNPPAAPRNATPATRHGMLAFTRGESLVEVGVVVWGLERGET